MAEGILKTGPSARRIIEHKVADALTRNGVYPASALSDGVRARATIVLIVWPPRCEPATWVTDDGNRSLTLDA